MEKVPLYMLFFLGMVAVSATIAALQIIDDARIIDLEV